LLKTQAPALLLQQGMVMNLALQVTFKGMEPSVAIEQRIHQEVHKLERFHSRVMGCRVVVEAPHRHHRKGNLYHVSIDLTVPGAEIVVNRNGERNHAHEDAYVAVRDAFAAAARKLEDHARRRRGDVKTHETPQHGRVTRVFAHEGYGFIESADGLDVYFHQNALQGADLATLEIGAPVRFEMTDTESDKGPQATTVLPIGKHQIAG
jgi:cold shock CspA family protein